LPLSEYHSPDVIKLNLPASHKYLSLVGACVAALLEREIQQKERRELIRQQVELAVHETCINIVEHAYLNKPGQIEIYFSLTENPRKLVIDLFDTGTPFDTTRLNLIDKEGLKERGYGLNLIYQLMENVVYLTEAGENHWHLEKTL